MTLSSHYFMNHSKLIKTICKSHAKLFSLKKNAANGFMNLYESLLFFISFWARIFVFLALLAEFSFCRENFFFFLLREFFFHCKKFYSLFRHENFLLLGNLSFVARIFLSSWDFLLWERFFYCKSFSAESKDFW